ncbi:MAG: hypothetical protein C5B57_11940 [Blastocatellia bacterium]|nr:MAG: hypothetical protein C5B57_11940 [Blastocatellia bacterium]
MRRGAPVCTLLLATVLWVVAGTHASSGANGRKPLLPEFQTSDRCIACHNGLLNSSGEDVSIGFDWRASMMGNSSRDPYWQASVRRESVDHAESKSAIEDECSICHMPIPRYEAKVRGRQGEVFSHLPFAADDKEGRQAADGVSCSVCHQISKDGLGTSQSFNGGFIVAPPDASDLRPEYGPFQIEAGHTRIMRSSSEGYRPTQSDHIRQSEMCATCHTLITQALGPDGTVVGHLPEQMPYQEWLHSDFKDKRSCQSCHMPVINEDVPITRVFGMPRPGVSRHVFVAANFFMQRMLNRYREFLGVTALPQELTSAADRTMQYLGSQAAHIAVEHVQVVSDRLVADVRVDNLGGHKLPTGYPSRRAWLHVVVRDRNGGRVFESGALNADGSIQGNDNDTDPTKFESHYLEIRSGDEVQIYESILGGPDGAPTTGLLTAVGYLKDNRLLPHGFDKRTAEPDIAVIGAAVNDANFSDVGDVVRYSVPVNGEGPFELEAELLYQPLSYRWATNLKMYGRYAEPKRFNEYYDSMSAATAVVLARGAVTVTRPSP